MSNDLLRGVLALTKALADPGRVRILQALRGRPLCVCQLVELLGLAPSTVSRHLTVLTQADLVACRKDGRWAFYARAGNHASPTVRAALRWLDGALDEDEAIRADRARLQRILEIPPEELCRRDPIR